MHPVEFSAVTAFDVCDFTGLIEIFAAVREPFSFMANDIGLSFSLMIAKGNLGWPKLSNLP